MNTWETLRLVTVREMVERGKSKAFLLTTGFTLLILVAALVVPVALDRSTDSYTLGVVGEGYEPIVASALAFGNADEDDGGVEIDTLTFATLVEAETALVAGTVDVVLVAGTELVTPAGAGAGGSGLEGLLQRSAAAVRLDGLTGAEARAAEVLSEDALEVRSLGDLDPADTQARAFVAFAGLLLMYMAILTYGTWTLMGVTEEKTNRVVEVLLAAVEPWQLLAGKVLGIGMLGLAQFVLTVLFAVVTIRITGAFELPAIPTAALPMLIVWFLLGYTLYAVGFAAAGSLVSRMEDAQTVATPFTIMSVVGFFISIQTLDDPSGIVAQVTSFIPVTAPFAVPVRLAFGAIEWWELTLSVLLMVGAIAGLIRLAGKVYSGGLLRFGAKVSWREAFRAAEM